MRRTSMLLLYAVALAAHANAIPYQASSQASAYASASSSASSYASSSATSEAHSSSSSNAEDGYILRNPGTGFLSQENRGEINQQTASTAYPTGVKSPQYTLQGGYTGQTQSTVQQTASTGLPLGFQSGHYQPGNPGGVQAGGGQTQEGGQYWWMGADSPFGPNGKPSVGCTSSRCAASGSFDLNKGSGGAQAANEIGQVGVNLQGNPFLGGSTNGVFNAGSGPNTATTSFGVFSTGSGQNIGSGAHSGVQPMDLSKNPFFNGGISAGGSSSAGANAAANANALAAANAAAKAQADAAARAQADAAARAQAEAAARAQAAADAAARAQADAAARAQAEAAARAQAAADAAARAEAEAAARAQADAAARAQAEAAARAQAAADAAARAQADAAARAQAQAAADAAARAQAAAAANAAARADAAAHAVASANAAATANANANAFANANAVSQNPFLGTGGDQSYDQQSQVPQSPDQYPQYPQVPQKNNQPQYPQPPQTNNEPQYPQYPEKNDQPQYPQPPQTNDQSQYPQPPQTNDQSQYPQPPQTNDQSQYPQPPQTNDQSQYPQPPQTNDQSQYPEYPQTPSQGPFIEYGPPQPNQNNYTPGLTLSCSGYNRICVAKSLCRNGYVVNSVKGLTQVRTENQQCDVNREVCCTMRNQGTKDQVSSGTGIDRPNGNRYPGNGGIFGDSQQPDTDLSSGDQKYENNGYLPPIKPDASGNVPSFTKYPKPGNPQDEVPSGSGPAPTHLQLGCAAALICVEEMYCAMDGMISKTPLALSSEQLLRRVPLSDCKNPDNGVIGKCCRDPDYTDPWPTGNLPANYSGGFDEQGFPSFLNLQRTKPGKKSPPTKTGRAPTKGGRPPVKGPQFPNFENRPNQITDSPNSFYNPTTPSNDVSSNGQQQIKPNGPPFPFPSFPDFPVNGNQKTYDTSSSNANPVIIAPHTPGSECGVRNSVRRPSGLTDVDVGFGEIPWQAMVLDNRYKKLLCSGAFIASNAVLTSANCVYGFNARDVSVKAGEWKLGYELKHEEPLPFEIVQLSSIVLHPGYVSGSPAHDVAILMLEYPVTLDQHIDTICLGRQQLPQPGSKCISTGWGKVIIENHVAGAIMHSIDLDILTPSECQQRVSQAEEQIELHETLVCTKAHKRNNNMCQVDPGGPLACDRGDGHYEIMGVYNQDTGCLPTNQVATFALIDVQWVRQTLANPPRYQNPTKSQRRIETVPPHQHANGQCDCQQSNLPPDNNKYLPPV